MNLGGRRTRQAAAVAVALALLVVGQARQSAAERRLAGRIGPTLPTAVALESIEAGRSFASAKVGFPEVPVRWRQPGAPTGADRLDGLVAAVDLPAGTMLGPGSAVAHPGDPHGSRSHPVAVPAAPDSALPSSR